MDQLNFKSKDFVHLHLHSDYSLLQSTIQLKPLAETPQELEHEGLCVDRLRQHVRRRFVLQHDEIGGLTPIIGYEAYFTHGSRFDRDSSSHRRRAALLQSGSAGQELDGLSKPCLSCLKGLYRRVASQTRIDLELSLNKAKV